MVETWDKTNAVCRRSMAAFQHIFEREREFYLAPAVPGCGHMAAGTAEVHTPLSPACRSIYKADLDLGLIRPFCLCYVTK